MEKKTKKKRLYQQWQFWLMVGVILAIISLIAPWRSEPHFKIYEEIWVGETQRHYIEVEEIFLGKCKEGFEQADEPSGLSRDILMCYQENCEYIEEINWSFCSNIYDFVVTQRISKSDLTINWLDENCKIQKGECLKWSKRDSDGISICKDEIKKYLCGEKHTHQYVVEVWNQIK